MQKKTTSEAVKNLKVDSAEFEAAIKKMIAAPPLRGPKPAAKRHRSDRPKTSR